MSPWLLSLLPAVPLVLAVLNLLTWVRPVPRRRAAGQRVSVLIPARNEARNIVAAVRSALVEPDVLEVIVCDDGSADGTGELVTAEARKEPRLKLLVGKPLPEGWVGKPHACHQLAEAANGEYLCFLDADVTLMPGGLSGALALFEGPRPPRVLSCFPRQELGTVAEKLILPLLALTYLSWLPLFLVSRGTSERTVAANGQLLLLSAKDYRALGGFAAVKDQLVDDVAFCRRAKRSGLRLGFVDGFLIARCRMYRGGAEVWRGFSKNILAGLNRSLLALGFVFALYAGSFVLPYLAALYGIFFDESLVVPALSGVVITSLERVSVAIRFRHPAWTVLSHPFSVIALLLIALNSLRWHLRGRVEWAGRSYGAKTGEIV